MTDVAAVLPRNSIRSEHRVWATVVLHPWFLITLIVWGHTIFLTGTLTDYWFEDDTEQQFMVAEYTSLVGYFFDREFISGFTTRVFTPMFFFSFRVDQLFTGHPSTLVAYLHTSISFWLTALLFYQVCLRPLGRCGALWTTFLWVLLPSTLTIVEFLSCRHYLEGLMFSLAAILVAQDVNARPVEETRFGHVMFAAVLYMAAALCKEVYVSSTLALLVWLFLRHRRFGAAAIMITTGAIYALYRIWAVGLVGGEFASGSALKLSALLDLIKELPFIFAGNTGGYLLLALAFAGAVRLALSRRLPLHIIAFFLIQAGIALLTITPVAEPLIHAVESLGSWYRIAFAFNTFALFCLAWLCVRLRRNNLIAVTVFLACGIIGAGADRAVSSWDELKGDYRREAMFYLEHSDRLLYSEVPAPWFIRGVHKLYASHLPVHYVTETHMSGQMAKNLLSRHTTIWRQREHVFNEDQKLFLELRGKYLEEGK